MQPKRNPCTACVFDFIFLSNQVAKPSLLGYSIDFSISQPQYSGKDYIFLLFSALSLHKKTVKAELQSLLSLF